MLGLPDGIRACLFDLDGVITDTARVHAAAWKEMFDAFLSERAERSGEAFVPFDPARDYDEYVDGKPRYDGVRSFLAARGIDLPEGSPDDAPDRETISGLGNRKNEIVLRLIREDGVDAYPGSVRYLQAAVDAGLRRAVVSSSTNCRDVLEAAGIEHYLEERIDGVVAEGEPHALPGTYVNGFYEVRPLPHAEPAYGDPEAGQSIVNVTNGKIIRLLLEDEPFDVRYGELRSHERVLDLRAGVLRRTVEWVSPAGKAARITSTRLVSFPHRALAAIQYEVEPLGEGPTPIVIQSELVANEPLPPAGN